MASIADESAAERHVRWGALRAHLRTEGVANIPPGLLRHPVPNTPTRSGVPLIAYYADVKQVSLGRHSPKDLIAVLLVVAIPILAFTPSRRRANRLSAMDMAGQRRSWTSLVGRSGVGFVYRTAAFTRRHDQGQGTVGLELRRAQPDSPGSEPAGALARRVHGHLRSETGSWVVPADRVVLQALGCLHCCFLATIPHSMPTGWRATSSLRPA